MQKPSYAKLILQKWHSCRSISLPIYLATIGPCFLGSLADSALAQPPSATAPALAQTAPQSKPKSQIDVRIDRWLAVQQPIGDVTFFQAGTTRLSRVGDKLQYVGDAITTGNKASAVLEVDTNIGIINVQEKTKLQIQQLSVAPDRGRITHLEVPYGQVRLKLRPFNQPGTQLQIRTPAGLSGVRGTEFGLAVQPSGKTTMATLSGAVVTAAQGTEVAVPAGFQNFTIPGEPPSAPMPLRDDTQLVYKFEKLLDRQLRSVRLVGQVDPVNAITIDGRPESTDREGRFSIPLPAFSRLSVRVMVTTPLGKTQSYELALR